MTVLSVHVDLASFEASFPSDMPVPERLRAFGTWLKKFPRGSLGYFDAFSSELLDETYTDNAAATVALRSALGIFLTLGDGSRLALWNHGGERPAVVLLGSDGDLENIAPDFDTFLSSWTKCKTGVRDLDDEPEEIESARPALAAWLASQGAKKSSAKVPSFSRWFKKTVKEAAPTKARIVPADSDRVEVDFASVRACAPKGFPFPERLERFAKWIAKQPKLGLTEDDLEVCGYAHSLTGDDLADGEAKKSVAFFLAMREVGGIRMTYIGLWDHGGDTPSVISRESETAWTTLAPDLDTFFCDWAAGRPGVSILENGNTATLAELGAWLAKEGATKRKARTPDVAAWIAKLKTDAKGKKPAKKAGVPFKPPADMAERALRVLGKAKDDPAVVDFANALGIDLPSVTEGKELDRFCVPKQGYALTFPFPKDKGTEQVRRLTSVRLHRAKSSAWSFAAGRDLTFSEFGGALPRGLSFMLSRKAVIDKLGQPTKTGDHALEWTDPATGITLVVEFASQWDKLPEGEMKAVALRR